MFRVWAWLFLSPFFALLALAASSQGGPVPVAAVASVSADKQPQAAAPPAATAPPVRRDIHIPMRWQCLLPDIDPFLEAQLPEGAESAVILEANPPEGPEPVPLLPACPPPARAGGENPVPLEDTFKNLSDNWHRRDAETAEAIRK